MQTLSSPTLREWDLNLMKKDMLKLEKEINSTWYFNTGLGQLIDRYMKESKNEPARGFK